MYKKQGLLPMNLWHLGAEDKESVVSLLLFMTKQRGAPHIEDKTG